MFTSVIVLPDGTQLKSGASETNAIQSVTLTECVNSGEELTLGSTCAAMLEAKVLTPSGGLDVAAGSEVTLYRGGEKIGLFTLEKPTRPTASTMKLTGYDRVAKLDKDLTGWVDALTGWPYTLQAFASMVCAACGLELVTEEFPNRNFVVNKFSKSCTGRQLMQWIGEIAGRFCRANADGKIELAQYAPVNARITATGDVYCLQNTLTYENYQVAQVEAVQIRLGDSGEGYLWPVKPEGINSYIITGNPLFTVVNDDISALDVIKEQIPYGYTPCKVTIPANPSIRAGSIVTVTDKNGRSFSALVMEKTSTGQKDTLTCTGSQRRDSASAVNNQSAGQTAAANQVYAQQAAQQAVDSQKQEEIFLKLTDNGRLQGLYMEDGELYINASYLKTGTIDASRVKVSNLSAGSISSGTIKGGSSSWDLKTGIFRSEGSSGTVEMKDGVISLYTAAGKKTATLANNAGSSGGSLRLFSADGTERVAFYVQSNEFHISCRNTDGTKVAHEMRFGQVNGVWTLIGI